MVQLWQNCQYCLNHDWICSGWRTELVYYETLFPLSLLSHFDKIFEKILCRRLISFLERNELLYCYQYGFRKLYSTGLALIEITDYIKRLLDEKKYVISIFIDFKKAFDTVDHEILLHKLEYYGIRGIANNFFRSYLTNRRQYTVINGIKSDLRTVSCGVPHCFSCYI